MNDDISAAGFEAELSAAAGRPHAVAVDGEGTALRLALRAFGVVSGDEVVVPSFGTPEMADAVRAAGAVPSSRTSSPPGTAWIPERSPPPSRRAPSP